MSALGEGSMKLLNGPKHWWRRWREGLYTFQREDGLYVCVIAATKAEAWSRAAGAALAYDGAPEWCRGLEIGTYLQGGYEVVGVDYDKRAYTLRDREGIDTVVECQL